MKPPLNPQATLLIIDDTPANLGLLFENLAQANYHILIADNGEQAIRQAQLAQPQLILLDVMMPGLDGFETCRRLKANPNTQAIPIIFMTALTDPIDEVTGLQLGAADYITKPIQMATTLARIETHLANHKLRQQLHEQIAELDAFAHTVAHDLKNPLSTLNGSTDLLLNYSTELTPDQQQDFLQGIYSNSRKMANIVDELLLLARLRREDVTIQAINMAQVLDQTLARLKFMQDEYSGEIILPGQWPSALGYAPWVEEVWVNYVSNGLKYGGRPPILELGATLQPEGMIRFWVKDNGPGLTPQEQQRLFTEFTRLNEVRTQGYGLGLSIVRRIMDKLGGRVGVESQAVSGQGCLFYFELPTI